MLNSNYDKSVDGNYDKKEVTTFIFNMLKKYGNYDKTEINKLITNNNKNTIEKLAEKQKEYGILKNLYSQESSKKRADNLYFNIKKYINIDVKSFLDFGGGSCDISYYLGNSLKARNIYCIDIENWMDMKWKRRNNVIFMNNLKLIKNKSIDVILTSHTLHHIPDDEIKIIIEEFNRILSDTGILVLKEHDSPDKKFNKLLDMQHIIYDVVISQTINYDNFIKKFYSNYKSIKDWNILFSKFYTLKILKLKTYDNSFISIYKKKSNNNNISNNNIKNNNISNYFINVDNINKSKLMISNVGRFSVSHADDAIKTANIIKSYFDSNITITDATANNGGNTIAFALTFNNVNSVEIDKIEYDILLNNINVYKLKNVKTYNDDYLNLLDKLKQDVVFIDPPWGGIHYKKITNLNLYLGKNTLVQVIDLLKNKCKAIVCKVPFNYNFSSLFKYGKYSKKIHLYVFQKYVIFILLNRSKENSNLDNYKRVNIK